MRQRVHGLPKRLCESLGYSRFHGTQKYLQDPAGDQVNPLLAARQHGVLDEFFQVIERALPRIQRNTAEPRFAVDTHHALPLLVFENGAVQGSDALQIETAGRWRRCFWVPGNMFGLHHLFPKAAHRFSLQACH